MMGGGGERAYGQVGEVDSRGKGTWGDRTMPTSSPPSKRGSVLRKNSLEATWSASKMHSSSWPGTGVPCIVEKTLFRLRLHHV